MTSFGHLVTTLAMLVSLLGACGKAQPKYGTILVLTLEQQSSSSRSSTTSKVSPVATTSARSSSSSSVNTSAPARTSGQTNEFPSVKAEQLAVAAAVLRRRLRRENRLTATVKAHEKNLIVDLPGVAAEALPPLEEKLLAHHSLHLHLLDEPTEKKATHFIARAIEALERQSMYGWDRPREDLATLRRKWGIKLVSKRRTRAGKTFYVDYLQIGAGGDKTKSRRQLSEFIDKLQALPSLTLSSRHTIVYEFVQAENDEPAVWRARVADSAPITGSKQISSIDTNKGLRGGATLAVSFDDAGRRELASSSTANVGGKVAVLLNQKLTVIITITEPITNGRIQIPLDNVPAAQANAIAAALATGELPPLTVAKRQTYDRR